MHYTVTFQTEPRFRSIRYGQGTIYSSGCGPASLCNALRAAGIADVGLQTMCAFAVSAGARVPGGTNMHTLLRAASKKYRFSYRTTNQNAALLAHLRAGGTAILHCGSAYKLFSNSGHFVAAVAANGQRITILDSYWYAGKYTATALRRKYAQVVQKGVVRTGLEQCGRATADRTPHYYLISKTHEEAEDMTEKQVRALIDKVAAETAKKAVSAWAKQAWQEATDAGIVDGSSPRSPVTREQLAQVLVNAGILPNEKPVQKWAKPAWDAAVAAGVMDGTNPRGVVTREQLAQVLLNAGLLPEDERDT